MSVLHSFLRSWAEACERRDLPKLLAEVAVPDELRSQPMRLGREFLFACALGPWEADDVLSEITLLTLDDDGAEVWRLRRLSGPQAASLTDGRLSAHYARSFVLATCARPVTATTGSRTRRPRAASTDR